jgi:hypothetical protein
MNSRIKHILQLSERDLNIIKHVARFKFGSMTDLSPTTALTPLWIRGKECTDIRDRLRAIPTETAPHIYQDELADLLADILRVFLTD